MQGFEHVEAEVRRLITAFNPDVFIVDIALHRGSRNVLYIMIDTDEGINISECARISRYLNREYFEIEEPWDFAFNLEVSSPGVGKPLKVMRQYHKSVGRKLKVKFHDNEVVKGKLEQVGDNQLVLRLPLKKKKKKVEGEDQNNVLEIKFDEIKEATVEISFD